MDARSGISRIGPRICGAEAMQRKDSPTGSATIALLLALFLLIFTLTTLYVFIKKTWWFPAPITVFGREIDQQFHRTLIITGIVFVLSQLGLAWIVFRYRDRGERAHYTEGNMTMEVLWT